MSNIKLRFKPPCNKKQWIRLRSLPCMDTEFLDWMASFMGGYITKIAQEEGFDTFYDALRYAGFGAPFDSEEGLLSNFAKFTESLHGLTLLEKFERSILVFDAIGEMHHVFPDIQSCINLAVMHNFKNLVTYYVLNCVDVYFGLQRGDTIFFTMEDETDVVTTRNFCIDRYKR